MQELPDLSILQTQIREFIVVSLQEFEFHCSVDAGCTGQRRAIDGIHQRAGGGLQKDS